MLWAALAGQCIFMATFSAGVGPCTWLLIPESFPLAARGVGVGIAMVVLLMGLGFGAAGILLIWVAAGAKKEEEEPDGRIRSQ